MTALRKVLVVDDDPVIGKSFDRVLTGKGYAVITAANGEEALNKLATEDYDLVYTDIKMPGMSGLEVAERVKAEQAVDAGRDHHRLRQCRERGARPRGRRHPPAQAAVAGDDRRQRARRDGSRARGRGRTGRGARRQGRAAVEAAPRESVIKGIALFFAAPFIGLAYMIALPFVGGAMIAWFGAKAAAEQYPGGARMRA